MKKLSRLRLSVHSVMSEGVVIELKCFLLHVHAMCCVFTVAQPIEMFLLHDKSSPLSASSVLSHLLVLFVKKGVKVCECATLATI